MKSKTVLALVLAFPLSASAVDMTWSGFGTIGYAQSDQPYNYLRFVDEDGTFKRDSLLGAQLDIKFDQHWALPSRPSWHPPTAAIRNGRACCPGPLFHGARSMTCWSGSVSFGCR